MSNVAVIGAGISGLSAACFAAKAGHRVFVLEKNTDIGGRARVYRENGFTFDMGPSWYWMPDIFDSFFNRFGKETSDYYELIQLDPGFQIFYGKDDVLKVPARMEELYEVFEDREKGSATKLKQYLAEAAYKYQVGMQQLVYKPALSITEYMNYKVLKGIASTQLFTPISRHVRKYFKNDQLIALMEFPVLFLGALPQKTPALYSLMNYAALQLGTWYPMGGMHRIIGAMSELAESMGVEIHTGTEVKNINTFGGYAQSLETINGKIHANAVIASCDYHHTESKLLQEGNRNYTEQYWEQKTFAPSCLIYYVGVNKKIPKLIHHNLFFDTDFEKHADDIYKSPRWPDEPLFYACCPSKTDDTVAPEGMENLFLLVPLASGLNDTEEMRERYFEQIIKRMEAICGTEILPHIVHKKTYCVNDFIKDYNAYKGNAYGLANTLKQTAILKPSIRNKKIKNFFYTGQLTVPGPGVPPSLISGQIVAEQVSKYLNTQVHESLI